ncbi:MAG: substrate-binding domain-containing protein [Candidatus Marinarcus sp.]|uniref:substrate-binding domain-containing protein n=1 Tax=Candidatus Marinarcus sp. TaxID=3100987 RepID=UPI003AFFA8D3
MKTFLTFCLFFLFSPHLFAYGKDFFLVDLYLKEHPHQKVISDTFVQVVDSPGVKLSVKQTKPVNIVMVYPGNQISDYWRRSKDSFVKRLDELNIKYSLSNYFTPSDIDMKAQAKKIFSAIKEDTDYIIFTLDANKHARFIQKIILDKKPKIILQNITTPLAKLADKQPFLYVGFDHVIGSKLIADYYIKKSQGQGKYALLYGTEGYVSYMRGDTFIEYVSEHSELKLVSSYYTDFSKEKAMNATREILKSHPDIKFIYACSTDVALGAMEVLKEQNLLGKIAINGWGGGSSELDAITNNMLDVTVMRVNDDNGVAMAEAIKLDLEGKSSEVPTIFSGQFHLVEKGIQKTLLDSYKSRAFRYTK